MTRAETHRTTTTAALLLMLLWGAAGVQAQDDEEAMEAAEGEDDIDEGAEADAEASAEFDGGASTEVSPGDAGGDASGFELGGRVGFALPMGQTLKHSDLSDSFVGAFPLQLDLGYRIMTQLSVGAYVSYGPALIGGALQDECNANPAYSCGATAFAAGVQAQYRFMPGSSADLWVGLGAGYELVTVTQDWKESGYWTRSSSALPELRAQLGVDFGSDPALAYGPFIGLSMSTFSAVSSDCDGSICSTDKIANADIESKLQASHQWLTLGFRGTFVL